MEGAELLADDTAVVQDRFTSCLKLCDVKVMKSKERQTAIRE